MTAVEPDQKLGQFPSLLDRPLTGVQTALPRYGIRWARYLAEFAI